MRFIGVMNVSSDINMKNIAPTLKGDTIILRKPKESDIDDRMEIGRSKVFVRMCGGDTRGDFRSFTKKDMEGWYKHVCSREYEWIIEFSGKCIGGIRLTINKPDNNARLAIGIYDDTLYGQGIGTQATRLVLEYAFNTLKLHRIDLKVLEYNKRAISCYKKCGFKIEGILRESAYIEDKWESDLIMSILDCEYNNSCVDRDKTLYSEMHAKEEECVGYSTEN